MTTLLIHVYKHVSYQNQRSYLSALLQCTNMSRRDRRPAVYEVNFELPRTSSPKCRPRWSVREWKLRTENPICTVQCHPQTYDETQSGDWLHQKEAEYTEWRELISRRNPGGPHKSEVKERILFHSQLLLVSYLAGRNGRRTGQDHGYKKYCSGDSEEFYSWLCRRQRLDPEVSE